MSIFEKFETGKLFLKGQEKTFKSIEWSPHPKFKGVSLKHLVTAKDTNGEFSYHLVRIKPQKKIGLHTHEIQLETHEIIAGHGICDVAGNKTIYEAGSIAILPAGVEHEITAGEDGLFIFAKFFPALC